ncbi:MAG: hypothetical protein V4696_03515 [Pseudomonadota bacterium]
MAEQMTDEMRDEITDWLAGHGCSASDESVDNLMCRLRPLFLEPSHAVGDRVELVAELFEIARPCFHYAKPSTPDGDMFEQSLQAKLLKNALGAIVDQRIDQLVADLAESRAEFADVVKK